MEVFRITSCKYCRDLSGFGAANYPGRWNSKGTYILYTAGSPSLAMLETLVHISSVARMPQFCMIKIQLDISPSDILYIQAKDLPAQWNKYPSPAMLQKIGDKFVEEGKFLVMSVPSAVQPYENNYLINPNHKDFSKIKIVEETGISFDDRLMKVKK